MNGSLIVITFDQQDRAETVFDALHAMRRRAMYSLDEALVVTRNRQGQVRLHHTPVLANTQAPRTLDVIAGLVFAGEDGVGNGRYATTEMKNDLADAGFDLKFLELVGQALQDDSSAIFFLVKRASLGDANEIIKVLSLFQGQIAHTTIAPEVEAYFNQLTAQ
ncbi:MAG: hypothetical protein GWP61_15020 [Chloroflexi bacterium]|jgi:uncharacterized membrane protein|nr:hypothetical protein [Chloroflexota bacterium]